MRIKQQRVDKLAPYAKNARTHSAAQVDQIAASIEEFGWTNPILVDAKGGVVAGHGRLLAAQKLGLVTVPTITLEGMTAKQRRAYVLADNKLAENAGWDQDLLRLELGALKEDGFNLDLIGFSVGELEQLFPAGSAGGGGENEVPEVMERPITKPGEVWQLDGHRVMCGDSTNADDVARLMAGEKAQALHADPPYGMGKEADGVENDNLYREKLDAFQMAWWSTFRPHLEDNASAHIWGQAADLWRLWYCGALRDTERMEMRNEIVWDKKTIPGMASPLLTQYPEASERCLFFQLGQQFLGNINTEDFPETWENLRSYMAGEAEAAGVGPRDVMEVCGCGMYGHWFSKSQYTLIPAKHYKALGQAYPGYFKRPWSELKAEWDRVKGSGRDVINGKLQGTRSYFDNSHEVMHDVWEFARVSGEERFGHATPKPVAMMERVMRSAVPAGALAVEPFGGSGSTLIGAEITGRRCNVMELKPEYVDVIVRRWQKFTGNTALLDGDGRTFGQVAIERAPDEA